MIFRYGALGSFDFRLLGTGLGFKCFFLTRELPRSTSMGDSILHVYIIFSSDAPIVRSLSNQCLNGLFLSCFLFFLALFFQIHYPPKKQLLADLALMSLTFNLLSGWKEPWLLFLAAVAVVRCKRALLLHVSPTSESDRAIKLIMSATQTEAGKMRVSGVFFQVKKSGRFFFLGGGRG